MIGWEGLKRHASVALAASIVLLASATMAAQAPQRDPRSLTTASAAAPPPAPSGAATISGMVVSADRDARPVRLASVVIIGATTGVLRVTSSDASGQFSFTNLPADRYLVGASKPPLLGAVAGARRPARPGTPIAVKDGEAIANVTVRLPAGAAIAGLILDERGEPAVGAMIGLQQRRMQGGERVLANVPGGVTSTDERGRYRFYSLPPGEYVAVAMRPGTATPRPMSDVDVDAALRGSAVATPALVDQTVSYAPVYFPGTTRESDAGAIALDVGDERQNVDFRLELVRTASVEGRVATSDGQPVPNVTVVARTASASSPLQTARGARTAADGAFRIPSMPPGSYTLIVSEPGPQGRFATAPVDVAGVDQLGVQLTMGPPLTLSVRIAFEGTTPPPALAGRRVPLLNVTPGMNAASAPIAAPTTATGGFTVTGLLPGQYVLGGPVFFGATSDSVIWALQSVVADGRDVTDLPIAIAADTLPKDVVVTFGDKWQELTGRLRQSSGAAASDYTIVMFPADKGYWLAGSRRILTARPGTDGQFRLGGQGPNTLPPGAYLLAAVTDLDRDEQFDPAFLNALTAAAIPLTLQPGERKVQDIVIK